MAKAKNSAEERRSSLVEECWPSEGEDVMGCVPPVLQTEWGGSDGGRPPVKTDGPN